METIYFTLKDYQTNYPTDLARFLNNFEGCDESDFVDKQLDIYGVLHNVLLYSDSATDYIEHFHNSDKFKTINPKVVSSIFERVADGDPPESGLQPSFNVTSGTVVYSGVLNHYKKERLQSSFSAIIQFLFSKLSVNDNTVNGFDISTLTGMNTKYDKEKLIEIFRNSSRFIEGDQESFIALCTPAPLPKDFKTLKWKTRHSKKAHASALVEFCYFLSGESFKKRVGVDYVRLIKNCFVDTNGNSIHVNSYEQTKYYSEFESIFGIVNTKPKALQ